MNLVLADHRMKETGVQSKLLECLSYCITNPLTHSPGYEHRHLAHAVVSELDQQVSSLLTNVFVEHDHLQEVREGGLVVQREVSPHGALARCHALRLQQSR